MFKKLLKRRKKNSELSENDSAGLSWEERLNSKIPQHVAIIMDGNGRWAKSRMQPRTFGHKAGAEALREIVRSSSKLGVKVLSAYAFSTENWKRPAMEVDFLMKLFEYYLDNEVKELHKNNVQLKLIGDISQLSAFLQKKIRESEAYTSKNTGMVLALAVNYGSRAEIIRGTKALAKRVQEGTLQVEDINEEILSKELYTADFPDVDLLIRPSGDLRISNFLLWQSAYAELWFTDKYWPDFTPDDLKEAIFSFQQRERRFGGLKNK